MARKGDYTHDRSIFEGGWSFDCRSVPSVVVKTVILLHLRQILGSTFACPGEPSQSNKEASGQRDERPPSTAEHPDHDFVLSEPSPAVVMEQSLVPGWSAAVVIGDGGTSFAVLRDGSNVFIIALHAHEEHGGANFGC